MHWFNRLMTSFNAPAPAPAAASTQVLEPCDLPGFARPGSDLTEQAATAGFLQDHAYVLAGEPPPLKAAALWWTGESTRVEALRHGLASTCGWLSPFMPTFVAEFDAFKSLHMLGPAGAGVALQEVRAAIRERRRLEQPAEQLLLGLYGTAWLADFVASLGFDGMSAHAMIRHVDVNDLLVGHCDYRTLGWRHCISLSRTDVAWLEEAFGAPDSHQGLEARWPEARRRAISRYCWSGLRRSNKASRQLTLSQKTMSGWLSDMAARQRSRVMLAQEFAEAD